MTNEEINKYIHTKIMGKANCEHESLSLDGFELSCDLCGYQFDMDLSWYVPDYCSDNLPRRLLNEVISAVAQYPSRGYFIKYILAAMNLPLDRQMDAVFASAEDIARACVEVHKEAVEEGL